MIALNMIVIFHKISEDWAGHCQGDLVSLNLLLVITGQSHTREVLVLPSLVIQTQVHLNTNVSCLASWKSFNF